MFNLVIFGAPGAGKGTQAQKLIEKYNPVHLSTGDMLREEMRNGTSPGNQIKELIEKGELVPDETVIEMIRRKIHKNKDACGFVFDGFPRTVEQAKALDAMLEEEGSAINMMITLEVEENTLIERIMKRGEISGRADDTNSETIKNRIKVYTEKTLPVVEYYKKQGKHISIDNMSPPEITFEKLSYHVNKSINKDL